MRWIGTDETNYIEMISGAFIGGLILMALGAIISPLGSFVAFNEMLGRYAIILNGLCILDI